MTLHVYVRPYQPATRYKIDPLGDGGIWIRNKPRSLMRCHKCNKLRWAKYCRVQVYYDGVYQWCRPGRGCKA